MTDQENTDVSQDGTQETPAQKAMSDALKKLGNEFAHKSFVEKHIAEVQTKEAPIRGSENPELKRGEIFRFERGQILKGYKILRAQIREAEKRGEDAGGKKELLKKIREQAKVLEKNLDAIERQCYENIKMVDVETEFGNFSVPVVEFDLREKEGAENGAEPEKDERTPYFFIPGMPTSDFHSSVSISMALALQGNRVCVPVDLETSSVKKPENFGEMLKKRGDFGMHAEVFKQIIRATGLEKVNIIGHSMGATVALELGADQDFKEMEDLVVMEPLGIEEKGLKKLAAQMIFGQTLLKFLPSAESRTKVAKQKKPKATGEMGLYLEDAKIMARELYDPEKLSNIKPKGRLKVCIGTDSPIMNVKKIEEAFAKAEGLRQGAPGESPLEIYEVQGGEHMWPVKGALGLAKMLEREKPESQITKVEISDLANSGMAGILENVK